MNMRYWQRIVLSGVVVCAALAQNLGMAPAQAQGLPSQSQSVVLLGLIAERGLSCGLLKPWEAAAIVAQTQEITRRWEPEQRVDIVAETKTKLAETECDSPSITVWLDAAQPNFDSQFLSHYLIVYRAMAQMALPPAVFEAVALRADYAPAIAAIGAKLVAIEASGKPAEGGKPWADTITKTTKAAEGFAEALMDKEGAETKRSLDQIAAWIAQSALIVELWLEDEAAISASAE